MERYKQKPLGEGVLFLLWGKIKRFIVPFAIAATSILLCNIFFPLDLGFNWPLSFLWFFVGQFVYSTLFFFIYKKTKRSLVFNIWCGVIICLSMSFFLFGVKAFDIPARGPAMLAVGILISQIPQIKIKLRSETKSRVLGILINAIAFTISAAASIYLAYLPGYAVWKLHLLCCVALPALVYFANALPVHGKFFNFLGEFSIFIYLAQCPILFHHYIFSDDTKDQFPWLVVCAVALFVINRIVNALIKKRNKNIAR